MTAKRRIKRRVDIEQLEKENRIDRFMLLVAMLLLTVAPLAFRIIRVPFASPDISNTKSVDTGIILDTFSVIKVRIVFVAVVLLLLCFLYKLFLTAYSLRFTFFDGLVLGLCVLFFLSFFMSDYKSVALFGFPNMMDGTMSHVFYCLLFLFGFHIFAKEHYARQFLVPLYIVCGVNAVISLLNFVGVPLVDTAIIKVVLGIPAGAKATTAAAFTSTFGNINYLSGFGGVVYAIFFARFLLLSKKGKIHWKSLIMVAASFMIVVTSLSSSGFLVFCAMTPVIIGLTMAVEFSKEKFIAVAVSLGVCAAIFIPLSIYNPVVLDETFGMFLPAKVPVEMMVSSRDSNNNRTILQSVNYGGRIDNSGANSTNSTSSGNMANAATYVGLAIRDEKMASPVAAASMAMKLLNAAERENGSRENDELILPVFPAPAIAPGSGRLYIWEEALELIRKKPLFGYGMDTLTFAFPQFSVNKVSGQGMYNVFVTKPHNIYVGYAYGAGITSLILFIVLIAAAAVLFFRYLILCRKEHRTVSDLIFCFSIGWIAYLLQGLVNDDLIATAPIWWSLFGVGIGLLYKEVGCKKGMDQIEKKRSL